MTTEIWINIGSGNGLLPDGNKLLPGAMLTKLSVSSCGIDDSPEGNFKENPQSAFTWYEHENDLFQDYSGNTQGTMSWRSQD